MCRKILYVSRPVKSVREARVHLRLRRPLPSPILLLLWICDPCPPSRLRGVSTTPLRLLSPRSSLPHQPGRLLCAAAAAWMLLVRCWISFVSSVLLTVRAPLPLLRPSRSRVPRCAPCDHAAGARAIHAGSFAHLILGGLDSMCWRPRGMRVRVESVLGVHRI